MWHSLISGARPEFTTKFRIWRSSITLDSCCWLEKSNPHGLRRTVSTILQKEIISDESSPKSLNTCTIYSWRMLFFDLRIHNLFEARVCQQCMATQLLASNPI